jgi:SAM-dependent methyltransferase
MLQGAAYWDDIYKTGRYADFWEYSHPSPELAMAVASGLARAGQVALDLGCGSGRDAVYLAQQGLRAIGVDLSACALELGRTQAAEAEVSVDWRVGSVLELPVQDASVDFATDRGCCHHLPDPERRIYAREVMRVLKPGSRLLIRGSAHTQFPFHAISVASLERAFAGHPYRLGVVAPLALITDRETIEGRIALVEKVQP